MSRNTTEGIAEQEHEEQVLEIAYRNHIEYETPGSYYLRKNSSSLRAPPRNEWICRLQKQFVSTRAEIHTPLKSRIELLPNL